jgi:hypothetical protein
MPALSGLSEPPILNLIEFKTKGNIREIMSLISAATERAIATESPTITFELLLEIARELRRK